MLRSTLILSTLILLMFALTSTLSLADMDCPSMRGIYGYDLASCQIRDNLGSDDRAYRAVQAGELQAFNRHRFTIENEIFALGHENCDELILTNREWARTAAAAPVSVPLESPIWGRQSLSVSREWQEGDRSFEQTWSLSKLSDGSLRYRSRIQRLEAGFWGRVRPRVSQIECTFKNANQP